MTYWFSELRLNADHSESLTAALELQKAAGAAGGSLNRDHAWLWKLFGEGASEDRPFIFRRIDRQQADSPKALGYYLVSSGRPRIEHPAWNLRSKPYEPVVTEGEQFAFDLRVNPVTSINGKRHDVVMHAKQTIRMQEGAPDWRSLRQCHHEEAVKPAAEFVYERISQWLAGTDQREGFARRHGFELAGEPRESLRVDAYQRHQILSEGRKIGLTTVDLSGRLHVTNAEKFRNALLRGAGHGKVYGCGLFLVRRA